MLRDSDDGDDALTQAQVVWCVAGIVCLVVASAISAGLQVSLYSIDRLFLRVLSLTGTPTECARARKLLAVLDLEHWTLVALILFNASCMMSLPILLERVLDQLTALIVSITALLFLGEVVPLSLFVRFAVPICASLVGVIWAAIVVTAPVSYPVGKLLDRLLGTNEELLDRDELAALIALPSLTTEDGDGDSSGSRHHRRSRHHNDDEGICCAREHEGDGDGGGGACGKHAAIAATTTCAAPERGHTQHQQQRAAASHVHTSPRERDTLRKAVSDVEMTAVVVSPHHRHRGDDAATAAAKVVGATTTTSSTAATATPADVTVVTTAASPPPRSRYELQEVEVKMLHSAMQLSTDTIKEHLRTSNADAFMLSSRDTLDADTISRILRTGYSRIPVYFGDDRRHVIGALIVNSLVRLCFTAPETAPLVGDYPLREVLRLSELASLHDAYTAFRSGMSNMAVVYNGNGCMVGLLTLTDVLAALYHANANTIVGITDHGLRRHEKMVKLVTGIKYMNAATGKTGLGRAATPAAAATTAATPTRHTQHTRGETTTTPPRRGVADDGSACTDNATSDVPPADHTATATPAASASASNVDECGVAAAAATDDMMRATTAMTRATPRE